MCLGTSWTKPLDAALALTTGYCITCFAAVQDARAGEDPLSRDPAQPDLLASTRHECIYHNNRHPVDAPKVVVFPTWREKKWRESKTFILNINTVDITITVISDRVTSKLSISSNKHDRKLASLICVFCSTDSPEREIRQKNQQTFL